MSEDGDYYSKFGPWEAVDPNYIVSADWENQNGLQSATIVLVNTDNINVDKITDFLIVPDRSAIYGPFAVSKYNIQGEHKQKTLNGILGNYIDYLMLDANETSQKLYNSVVLQIDELFDIDPFRSFTIKRGVGNVLTKKGYRNLIQSEILNVRNLSGLREVLERWGMIPWVYAEPASTDRGGRELSIASTEIPITIKVLPRYPVGNSDYSHDQNVELWRFNATDRTKIEKNTTRTTSLKNVTLEVDQTFSVDEILNKRNQYRNRKIKTVFRRFSDLVTNVIIFEQGENEPPIYLDQLQGEEIALVYADLMRWDLQWSAETISATRRKILSDYAVQPRHRIDYNGDEWLIKNITHKWNDEDGYSQKLDLALVQNNAVTELVTPTIERKKIATSNTADE